MKRTRPLAAALALAFAVTAHAETDLADIPMAVANNVAPNFMFMVDGSGSMVNIVPETPYDPNASYPCTGLTFSDSSNVQLRVDNKGSDKGKPYIYTNSTYYTYSTNNTDKKTAARCFDNSATYLAQLYGNSGDSNYYYQSYTGARYTGHYLNWFFGPYGGPSTGWNRTKPLSDGSDVKQRIEIARTAAKSALDSLPLPQGGSTTAKVRAGLSTYYSSDGGQLLVAMQDLNTSSLSTLKTAVTNLNATTNTPLSETLADIGHYFTIGYTGDLTLHPGTTGETTASVANVFAQNSRSSCLVFSGSKRSCSNAASPIQYWCQRSYALLLTDGRSLSDTDLSNNSYLSDYDGDCSKKSSCDSYDRKKTESYESSGSDYLDDVAQAIYEIDLRPDLTAPSGQAKKNNVVTYTIGFADEDVKKDAILKDTAAQGGGIFLTADDEASLSNAFSQALADAFAKDGAAAAVAVANTEITHDGIGYASSYNSGYWTGDLKAYSLNPATGLPIEPAIWSAQSLLDARTPASRLIASWNSNGQAFTSANFNGVAGLNTDLINWIRGDDSHEGTTYRRREHLLGDIINAEAVYVSYADKSVIYQAANDGMVHAFDASTKASVATRGQELWAYLPGVLLDDMTDLADLNYSHRAFIDATPAVVDVESGGSTRKVLVGGFGKGERAYYALDISTHAAASESDVANKVLWEFTHAQLGYTYGTPMLVKSPSGWVALLTSGYNNGSTISGDGVGRVFVLDPVTGNLLHTISTGVGSSGAPSGLAHLGKQRGRPDSEVVEHVYGGDLLGNVWRFDLNTWTATRIAELTDPSGNAQPVTSAPAVEAGPLGTAGSYFVYVGTGQYLGDTDVPGNSPENANATQVQSMYGIIDDTNEAVSLPNIRNSDPDACPANGGDGDFLCQSLTLNAGGTSYSASHTAMDGANRGWYFDLPMTNARINTHPALTDTGVLVFTVNIPTNVTCDPGGSSWLVAIMARNGGAVPKNVASGDYNAGATFLGNALGSRPVIVQGADGKRALIRMSNDDFVAPQIPEPPSVSSKWKRLYWRELM